LLARSFARLRPGRQPFIPPVTQQPRYAIARRRLLRQIKVLRGLCREKPPTKSKGARRMKTMLKVGVAAAGVLMMGAPALAEQGDVLIRLRAITVQPQEKVGPVLPSFPTSSGRITNAYAPEIDFTYMLTNHLGIEVIAATTKHCVDGGGSLAAVGRLACTWVLPPTVTLQYHFVPEGKVHPYVGAGVNWTLFYNEKASTELVNAIGATDVNLSSSWGYALQAGIDFDISEKMFLNLDVKYVDMDTNARLTTGAAVNNLRANINPLIVGVGVGWRF
jgi:outer membrane protein